MALPYQDSGAFGLRARACSKQVWASACFTFSSRSAPLLCPVLASLPGAGGGGGGGGAPPFAIILRQAASPAAAFGCPNCSACSKHSIASWKRLLLPSVAPLLNQ